MKRAILGAVFVALAGVSSIHANPLTAGNAKSDALRGVAMHRALTPNVPKTPIAFGYIDSTGAVESGSGNFTASFNSTTNTYTIAIDQIGYYYSWYSTVVTSSAPTPSVCTTGSLAGNLLVNCYTVRGEPTAARFAFITY
ncbi:MAG TPA: hypothetical protein VMF58_02240 [Rhizomicrobium sp.]|nr:hypothetical protein [Rhizomicrobium sp.]